MREKLVKARAALEKMDEKRCDTSKIIPSDVTLDEKALERLRKRLLPDRSVQEYVKGVLKRTKVIIDKVGVPLK